jgi:hypothetical protein
LAAAALLRFFVADRVLAAPGNVYTETQLQAVNASYFDAGTGQPRSGATVTLTSTVRGDARASTGDRAVWDAFAVLEDLQNRRQLDITQFRMVFDRRSAALVNCCRATAVPVPGGPTTYGLFFPIGVEKRAYNVYDVETGRSWPMRFEGTETIEGMEVYRYVQRIDQTNVGEQSGGVPSTLLGLPGPNRTVPADRWYGGTTTMWIEPRSGVLVDRRQQISSSVRGRDGQGDLVTAEIDLRMTEADRRELAGRAQDTATAALWLRTAGPITALAAGLLLLALAAVAARARRRPRQTLIEEPF